MLAKEWLDRIHKETELNSDYKIAAAWGISRQAISKYRKPEKTFSDEVALKVAKLLNENPMKVIASQSLIRAKNDEVKMFWNKMAGKTPTFYLTYLLVISTVLSALLGIAYHFLKKANLLSDTLYTAQQYILCKIRFINRFTYKSSLSQCIPALSPL